MLKFKKDWKGRTWDWAIGDDLVAWDSWSLFFIVVSEALRWKSPEERVLEIGSEFETALEFEWVRELPNFAHPGLLEEQTTVRYTNFKGKSFSKYNRLDLFYFYSNSTLSYINKHIFLFTLSCISSINTYLYLKIMTLIRKIALHFKDPICQNIEHVFLFQVCFCEWKFLLIESFWIIRKLIIFWSN